ncbi:metastasis-associated protein MTA3-like isoform X4 [Scylla paramamosain]|uniref:metastasis-associated protein MTA3-like isoform X4 n=1 Tax=Scylla paramamosain TaxID=85552 RepID=UPI003083D5A8
MASNMYRVGDYVYFETSSTSPYQIRRIEELNKTPNGNVEAKVMCFYRRRDISSSLIMLADKHQNGHGGTWDLCGGFKKLLKSQDTSGAPLSEGVASEASQQGALEEDESDSEGGEVGGGASIITPTGETLTPQERHQLRHRELFLSRQIETLPATHIRGKCTVTLLNETELLLAYLNKDDTFFYSLVYDPQQKTLLADKGEIRVGSRFQADITSLLKEGESDGRNLEDLESLVWTPCHGLTDRQIDQFLVMSRSVGTFARALDCSSSVKQPSLHMSAAAASRDVTLFHAMDTLHKHNYDISKALCSLIPATGPVLCRDEMEEWSASEANLFEEALEKYGKDFNDIRQDFLPWKTLKNIIEYYYMWKTTDRYVQQKRVKAVEAESKLKQVYIPNYNKPNPAALSNGKTSTTTTTTTTSSTSSASSTMVNGADVSVSGKACESCHATSSSQWYAWGPSHLQCRLCSSCWQYWKKFGGLKLPSRIGKEEERLHSGGSRSQRCNVGGCGREYKTRSQLIRHAAQAHGVALRAGSPRPIMKTRAAIMVHSSLQIRVMRRLCHDLIQPRKAGRNPTWPLNPAVIRQECLLRMGGKTFDDYAYLVKRGTGRRRGQVSQVSVRLGQKSAACPAWMLPTDKSLLPKQPHIEFPKPPKGPDGSLIYTPVPNKDLPVVNNTSPPLLRRRTYEEINGMDESELEEGGTSSNQTAERDGGQRLNTPGPAGGGASSRIDSHSSGCQWGSRGAHTSPGSPQHPKPGQNSHSVSRGGPSTHHLMDGRP